MLLIERAVKGPWLLSDAFSPAKVSPGLTEAFYKGISSRCTSHIRSSAQIKAQILLTLKAAILPRVAEFFSESCLCQSEAVPPILAEPIISVVVTH